MKTNHFLQNCIRSSRGKIIGRLMGLMIIFFGTGLIFCAEEQSNSANSNLTPEESYRQLVAGNARYIKQLKEGALKLPELSKEEDRFPIATILYSSDLDKKPSQLVDLSDKDLYMLPIQLGAFSKDNLADLDYGIMNLRTPVAVVLTHIPSRDILNFIRQFDVLESQATTESKKTFSTEEANQKELSDSQELYNLVGPAIKRSREAYPDLKGEDLAAVVSEALAWQSLEAILMQSTAATSLIKAGSLDLIAAIVDDTTGRINWLGAHPLQEEFLKPVPEDVKKTLKKVKEQPAEVKEEDLPAQLDDIVIDNYIEEYQNNYYYTDVIQDYYVQPYCYTPYWALFRPRCWSYRPWFGIQVGPFIPFPCYHPWGGPPPMPWWHHHGWWVGFDFFGPAIHFGPTWRPIDPWWGRPFFHGPGFGPHHRPGPHPGFGPGPRPYPIDPIRQMIHEGRGRDFRPLPHGDRPGFRPGTGPHDFDGPRRPGPAPIGPRPGIGKPGPGTPGAHGFGSGPDNHGGQFGHRPSTNRDPGGRPNGSHDHYNIGGMRPTNRPISGPGSERPGSGVHRPWGDANKPGGDAGKPGIGTSRPGGDSGKPGIGTPRPGGEAGKPGIGTMRPGGDSGKPGIGTPRPGGEAGKPGIGTMRPGGEAGKPGIGTSRPGGDSGKPGIGTMRPGGEAGKPGIGTMRPGGDSGKPEIGTMRPGGEAGKPGIGTSRPGGEAGKPGIGTSRPGDDTGKPGIGTSRPGGEAGKPGIGTSRPGGEAGKPGIGTSRPGGEAAHRPWGGTNQPGSNTNRLGGNIKLPGSGTTRPGASSINTPSPERTPAQISANTSPTENRPSGSSSARFGNFRGNNLNIPSYSGTRNSGTNPQHQENSRDGSSFNRRNLSSGQTGGTFGNFQSGSQNGTSRNSDSLRTNRQYPSTSRFNTGSNYRSPEYQRNSFPSRNPSFGSSERNNRQNAVPRAPSTNRSFDNTPSRTFNNVPRSNNSSPRNFGGATTSSRNFGGATASPRNFGGATASPRNFGGATASPRNFGAGQGRAVGGGPRR